MRIVFLSPVAVVGGAERILVMAIAGIKREWPASVLRVIVPCDGPLVAAIHEAGGETEIVPMPTALTRIGDSQFRQSSRWLQRLALLIRFMRVIPDAVRYVNRLRNAIARFRPHIVHSNGIKTHLLSRVAVSSSIPVVWHLHDFFGSRPLAGRLLRLAGRRVRAGIAISAAVAADTRRVLPRLPVTIVPNAVDLTRFSPGPGDDLDQLSGLPLPAIDTVRVGLVATYARWKGHLAFLDSARRLLNSADLPVRWYIIGGPIYHTAAQFTESELRREVAERGLQERVGFVPFQADPVGVYRALDIVVHASTLPEPFGLTVVEAMACGRAVVVSAAGGAAELFTDGRDAIGIPPGDSSSLATAVRRLAVDSVERARLGSAARVTAEMRFNSRRFGPQICEVYSRLIGPHGM